MAMERRWFTVLINDMNELRDRPRDHPHDSLPLERRSDIELYGRRWNRTDGDWMNASSFLA